MDVCALCNSKYKNLGSHVRQAHNMSMEEYAAVNEESLDLTDESDMAQVPLSKAGITVTNVLQRICGSENYLSLKEFRYKN